MSELSRKIHISIPEELHKRIRIRCACDDVSIQDYVASLIERNMASYVPNDKLAAKAIGQKRRPSGE